MRAAPAYMIGKVVHDYALGMNGVVISGAWVEPGSKEGTFKELPWEWLVLYEDGELQGADTNDLQEVTS